MRNLFLLETFFKKETLFYKKPVMIERFRNCYHSISRVRKSYWRHQNHVSRSITGVKRKNDYFWWFKKNVLEQNLFILIFLIDLEWSILAIFKKSLQKNTPTRAVR